MRRDQWFLGILIIFIALLVFFGGNSGFSTQRWLANGFGRSSDDLSGARDLQAENDVLKAKVAVFQEKMRDGADKFSGVTVSVYSRYPFNLKDELSVDAGSNLGVAKGQAATFRGLLIGKVEQVMNERAIVKTIFDSRFEIAVRVGGTSVDALLVGGAEPKLTLITKDAKMSVGDTVYSAATEIPYGLPIGTLGATYESADHLFQEARLNLSYNPNDFRTLFLIIPR